MFDRLVKLKLKLYETSGEQRGEKRESKEVEESSYVKKSLSISPIKPKLLRGWP